MKLKIIALVFLTFPYINMLLEKIFESYALIFIFIDVIYYLPVSEIVNSVFFTKTEVGYIPTFYGRLFTLIVYYIIIFLSVKIINSFKSKKRTGW